MTGEDYNPGLVIGTAELLRDVIACEEAVFLHGALVECEYLRPYVSAKWPGEQTGDGRFLRAFLKCPQTARQMRRANQEKKA